MSRARLAVMPRASVSIQQIREELSWVGQTPDPQSAAAETGDAASRVDTAQVRVVIRPQRSCGRSDGNTSARGVASISGTGAKSRGEWLLTKEGAPNAHTVHKPI